jgi:3-phosphoshikimate 1-carboxyvinyltransferase
VSDARAIEPLPGPVDATVRVPGSKSVTNRALVAAALADGRSRLTGVLVADDTMAMVEALRALDVGVTVDEAAAVAEVVGSGGRLPARAVALDARQSGTTARFLAPLLALGSGPYRLDGSAQLRARPMGPALEALTALGARVEAGGEPGRLPVTIIGGGRLRGGSVAVGADVSSQFLSGLLLAGPLMPEGLVLQLTTPAVSRPYLDLTVATMRAFAARVDVPDDRSFAVAPGGYRPTDHAVEPDASAASYLFAAAAICGGRVRVEGLGTGTVQGDLAFVDVLAQMGAHVERTAGWTEVTGMGTLRGVDVDLGQLSDTAQTLAAVAVFAEGPTRVTGIGFIRRKETDRIAAVVAELRRCGVQAEEEPDGFVVHPGTPRPTTVRTYDDHRMAMSFALLGLRAPGIRIADPGCVAKTYPGFFADLDRLRTAAPVPTGRLPPVRVIAIDGPAGSGKSTIARRLAGALDMAYLDTGAMYRGVAFAALRRGLDPGESDGVARLVRDLELVVGPDGITVDGVDATIEIRGPEVTKAVSAVASNPAVRTELVRRQREWVTSHGASVVEGRDIGTVVFPDAVLKAYLTARLEVRAGRRHREVTDLDYEAVEADMERRDTVDTERDVDPLQQAGDAVVIDTSDRSVDEIVADLVARL